ncbi:hypothetical protein EVG20_g7518 [Dentipellis fragilis]|uniref:DUF7330 domain-containing protein n=1 Tax=Dentipellis fragilis TaxID=205917 RepID=A0A4Y9YEN3_9AGAM|nr:hypothetical protein EVG20_g7518 [Dentipellis fragilis]
MDPEELALIFLHSASSILPSPTMILTTDKEGIPMETKRADHVPSEVEGESQPPPYSPPAPGASPKSSTRPADLPPTNFLYITRQHNNIKGEYLLDIDAPPPPTNALVKNDQCPNSHGGLEHRDNLRLESEHAMVMARIWIADKPERVEESDKRRVRIKLLSTHSKVRGTIHADGPHRPLLSIVAKSTHSTVSLKLPRSFHGQLIIYTVHGRVKLSPDVERRMTTLSEVDGTRVCFVGPRPRHWKTTMQLDGSDIDPKNIAGDGEEVDEAYAGSTYSVVRVWYEDEADPERGPSVFDFVTRLNATMILDVDKTADEQGAAQAAVTNTVDDIPSEEEPHPPPYSPPKSSASPISPPLKFPIDLPPTNFLYIFRPLAAIKGEYLLDINAAPPPTNALVKPDQIADFDGGLVRKDNLRLESTHSSVEGLVWVASDPVRDGESENTTRHARIKLLSTHGSVRGTIHADGPGPHRPLLSVVTRSTYGTVTLKLPRSFHGQLILYTIHGRVKLSPELERRAATLSEVDGTRVCFVGSRPNQWRTTLKLDGTDTDPADIAKGGDLVDEAYAGSAYGTIKVRYEDEDEPEPKGLGMVGSFMKILGLDF